MPLIVINSPGATLGVDSTHFTLHSAGKKVGRIPPRMIDSLVISSGVTITRTALGRIGRAGIPAVLLDHEGRIEARLLPPWRNDPAPRLAQARLHQDPAASLALARSLVAAKITNQTALLSQWLSNNKDPQVSAARKTLKALLAALPSAASAGELRGHEGAAAAAYFPAFGRTLTAGWTSFTHRSRRPPTDPVNALLSYLYAVLANRMHSFLEALGLDPYVGLYHATEPRRPSLALDLIEPLRPAIADRFARRLLNLGQIRQEHFQTRDQPDGRAVYLNSEGRDAFARAAAPWLAACDFEIPAPGAPAPPSPDSLLIQAAESFRDHLRDPAAHPFTPFTLPL